MKKMNLLPDRRPRCPRLRVFNFTRRGDGGVAIERPRLFISGAPEKVRSGGSRMMYYAGNIRQQVSREDVCGPGGRSVARFAIKVHTH